MTGLSATYYVDVVCSHTWCTRAAVERLAAEHGDRLTWQYVLYPLLRDDQQFHDRWNHLRQLRDIGPHWAEVSEHLGEPIAHTLWRDDPIRSTVPAAIACTAAERQGSEAMIRLYQGLQRATMAQKRDIGRRDEILAVAAAAGLDTGRLATDMDDPVVIALAETRIREAREKGVRSRPTVIFRNARGEEYWVIGPQPWEAYQQAAEHMLRERPLPGGIIRAGGRIFGYSDLTSGRPQLADGLWQAPVHRPNGNAWVETHLLAVEMDAMATKGLQLLELLHRAEVTLVTVQGRLGDSPVQWLGVRTLHAADESPVADRERAVSVLTYALSVAHIQAQPVPVAALQAAADLIGTATEAIGLRWLPRARVEGSRPLGDLAKVLPADGLLVTLFEPVAGADLNRQLAALESARRRFEHLARDPQQQQLLGPALNDSLWMRTQQITRLDAAKAVGAWDVTPILFTAGPTEPVADLLTDRLQDPGAPYPLRATAAGEGDVGHLRHHGLTWTVCAEREMQGTLRWTTRLGANEAVVYVGS